MLTDNRHRVVYNNGQVSCVLPDRDTALSFAKFTTTTDKRPLALARIKKYKKTYRV
jgi:hypothetical protein